MNVEGYSADFDPSRAGDGTYASRRGRARVDLSAAVVIVLALAVMVPVAARVPGFSSIPELVGLAELAELAHPVVPASLILMLWWLLSRLHPGMFLAGPQPMRWLVAGYLASVCLSLAVASVRSLTAAEARGADQALLMSVVFAGVVLSTADGVSTWRRLTVVVDALVWLATASSILLIVWTVGGGWAGFDVASPATVVAVAAPLAGYGIARATSWKARLSYGAAVAVCASGVVLVLRRADGDPAHVAGAGRIAVAELFSSQRYELATPYVVQYPWLGRGAGTWVAQRYPMVNDEWLLTALTGGVFAVVMFAALHLSAIGMCLLAMRRADAKQARVLCAVLAAGLMTALVVSAATNSMVGVGYPVTLAVMLGCAGAAWRLTHPDRHIRTASAGS